MPEILKLEAGLIIWELVAFGGLLIVLWRFAWGPLLGILKEREDTIRGSIEKAEETRVEAEKLMEDYKRQLAEGRAEAKQIIEESRKFGETAKADIVKTAREEAEQIKNRATAEINRETEMALVQVQQKIADLTMDAASRVVSQALDKKGHERLIDDFLSGVSGLSDS